MNHMRLAGVMSIQLTGQPLEGKLLQEEVPAQGRMRLPKPINFESTSLGRCGLESEEAYALSCIWDRQS